MNKYTRLLKTYKGFVLPVVIFIFCGLAILVGVLPMGQKISDALGEIKTLKADNDALNIKLATLQNLDEDTMRQQLQHLVEAVPSEKSLSTLFTATDQVFSSSGLVTQGLTIKSPGNISTESAMRQSQEEKKVGSNILSMSVELQGKVDQLKPFFDKVNSIRRLLNVETFSFAFSTKENEKDIIKLSADVYGYYLPFPTTLGRATEKLVPFTAEEEQTIAKAEAIPLANTQVNPDSLVVPVTPAKADPFSK
jgi:Tfp pilus assembly protein PilO